MIILRFVHHRIIGSDLIDFQTSGMYSHVDALTPDAKYIGAHASTGVEARPMGYDTGTFDREKFLLLPADPDTSGKFYHYLRATVGEPYDFGAIAGFVSHLDIHQKHRIICSALHTLAARWCEYLPTPLPVPAHEISPRDLELGLTMRSDVREITADDPIFLAHISSNG